MAYERTSDVKVKGDSLDAFVENLSKAFSVQLSIRNAEDEMKFQESVLSGDLDLEAQKEYRKEQLKRVSDDPTERKRIKLEVANLGKMIEQKNFADEYLDRLVGFESGMSSIDSIITWLEDQKANTNDDQILASIDKSLLEKKSQKFDLTKQLLENQTAYAVKDKSDSVIGDQISRVSAAKVSALLSGNNTLVSVYDLQLQSLQKARDENDINKELKGFAVASLTNNSSAVGLLDAYNGKISGSNMNTPVKIGDVTYASAREYWTFKRDSYLADTSGSGFFSRLGNEVDTSIKTQNSANALSRESLGSTISIFDKVAARPELQGFQIQLVSAKQSSLQYGADSLVNKILSNYSVTYDLNKAMGEINSLKTMGVNVDKPYADIIGTASSIKNAQVSGILETARGMMQLDPNLAPSAAVAAAVGQGAGAVVSPTEAATKSETQIATDLAAGFNQKSFTNDPRTTTTVSPPAPAAPAPKPPAPAPTPTPPILINKQLDFGVTDPQVRALQQFLNKSGFVVAQAGQPGSAGFETDYFGPATQAALKKFQAAQGIVSTGDAVSTGYGRLGPQTLSAVQGYK